MKKLCIVVVLLLLAYYYQRTTPLPEPPPVIAAATPEPRLQLYFHSSLDAPPMTSGTSTGMGYYSTSAVSAFGTGARLGEGSRPDARRK